MGCALGDALGLAMEGLRADQIARRFGKVSTFSMAGSMGFVSDDTEQSALLARALCLYPDDAAACAERFKLSLAGWFLRLPIGIGRATLQACLKILCRAKNTAINSAGNGSAMRAAILGVFFFDDAQKRKEFGEAICKVTHSDARAVAGALFVAELAAACTRNFRSKDAKTCFAEAVATVEEKQLKEKLQQVIRLTERNLSLAEAAPMIGTSGFVLHSVPLAAFCFINFGDGEPMEAISQIISAGGDTDSNAAILASWLGAKHGEQGLGSELFNEIAGPFNAKYLRNLANYLALIKRSSFTEAQSSSEDESEEETPEMELPGYNWGEALIHNFSFLFLVLIHILIRIFFLAEELLRKLISPPAPKISKKK